MERETYYVVCAPGLEAVTSAEMRGIGLLPKPAGKRRKPDLRPEHDESGGVAFDGFREHMYRANLLLRTAGRVLMRIGEFNAYSFPELRHKAAQLPWERYITPGQPLRMRVTSHQSKLYHTDAVAERVLGAVGDRLGRTPAEEDILGQIIVVRFLNNRAVISVDTSGALLHKRGYRLETAKAPLRETLAAAMLLASGWDQTAPLLDPFCGSGTIAIEAALMAAGIPPGLNRRFAFMDMPDYDEQLWQAQLEKYAPPQGKSMPVIQASDRDAGAVRAAQANAERAGMASHIAFNTRAVSAVEPPPGPGWVVTNPPYGLRIDENKDLRNLYAQLGNVLRVNCQGWTAAVLTSEIRLLKQTGLALETALSTVNGGVNVRMGLGKVEAQSTE